MRSGMTLMSVMVAVALAGIVALAVARLLGNQTKTMAVIRLREQREHLLKHYKNIVTSGWDATRSGCGGAICTRTSGVIIPGTYGNGTLYLADNLYEYNYTGGTADRWWKVTAERVDLSSGGILQSDKYVASERMVAMRIKVDFVRKEHPLVNIKLASRDEIVFLHHNTSSALDSNSTQCDSGTHKTQLDGSGGQLYSGIGALIQYDFISNYSKCSQVPLVKNGTTCNDNFEALLGFFRTTSAGALKDQLVTGKGICSIRDKDNALAEIRGMTEKRTVESQYCLKQGYIERMEPDEDPVCVEPNSGDEQRVAAYSVAHKKTCDWFEKIFTIERRLTPGGNGTPATYATLSDCAVYRYKGIHSFVPHGTPWGGERRAIVDYEDSHGAGVGPPGPTGNRGFNNGPTGPPGFPGARGSPCPPCPP